MGIPTENTGGDCFVEAVNNAMADKSLYVVHGIVHGQGALEGIVFPHAWNETDDGYVIDTSNGNDVSMPVDAYYAIGRIDHADVRKYDYRQMAQEVVRTGTYGPWDDMLDFDYRVVTSRKTNRERIEMGDNMSRIARRALRKRAGSETYIDAKRANRRTGRVFDEPPGFSDAERRIYWYELDENQRADVYYCGWHVVWDKLTDSQRKAIEDVWNPDGEFESLNEFPRGFWANRRVSVSLEDSLRGILDDIDADDMGSRVRDYVDERIDLSSDLIATSEKYGVDPERLRELRERVSDWYERIYDSYDNVPGYQEAIDAGDALIRSHAPYVDAIIEYRGDMFSSDREVAALAFAMDELGLASNGVAYGSRKLVRRAFSGGTYNVTYGEGFETSSMRGVDVERVADFLEQEARFLRTNTPGRDYLMTIQIQRVD